MARRIVSALAWLPAPVAVTDRLCSHALIEGSSMQPALNPAASERQDRVLTDKLSLGVYKFTRGDVVTFWSPSHPDRLLVKRLIALEGDWLTTPGSSQIQKIPQGCCWVEGDNRDDSADSSSTFGPIPLALVDARVLAVLWPPERMGRVASAMPPGRLLRRNPHAVHGTWHDGAMGG